MKLLGRISLFFRLADRISLISICSARPFNVFDMKEVLRSL